MDDRIYRNAAINEIFNLLIVHGSEGSWVNLTDVREALERMPSAEQPLPAKRQKASDLPIILSHATRTGVMTFPNRNMGGRDLVIVWLKKEIPSGESYDLQDIDGVKAVLHFSDINSLRVTVNCLDQTLKKWLKEGVKNEAD